MRSISRSAPGRRASVPTIRTTTWCRSATSAVCGDCTSRAKLTSRTFESGAGAMTYQNFKFDVDADGIALVTWDMPDRSMNVINLTVIEELTAIADKVAGDAAIKGAVVMGGKDT